MNGKNVNHIGDGLSKVSAAEELNTLSYLVRKHPEEAMMHLSAKDMVASMEERGLMDDQFITAEAVRRGLIKLSEG